MEKQGLYNFLIHTRNSMGEETHELKPHIVIVHEIPSMYMTYYINRDRINAYMYLRYVSFTIAYKICDDPVVTFPN